MLLKLTVCPESEELSMPSTLVPTKDAKLEKFMDSLEDKMVDLEEKQRDLKYIYISIILGPICFSFHLFISFYYTGPSFRVWPLAIMCLFSYLFLVLLTMNGCLWWKRLRQVYLAYGRLRNSICFSDEMRSHSKEIEWIRQMRRASERLNNWRNVMDILFILFITFYYIVLVAGNVYLFYHRFITCQGAVDCMINGFMIIAIAIVNLASLEFPIRSMNSVRKTKKTVEKCAKLLGKSSLVSV